MNLIVDAGNTSVKLAIFNNNSMVHFVNSTQESFLKNIQHLFSDFPKIDHAIVSSVSLLGKKDIDALSVFCKVHELTYYSKVPFKNSYASPNTLGVDRLALAAAAFYHNGNSNTLVIDAGSCITYDMVNDYGEYVGGAISPGIAMRFKAMHNQTANLPLLEKDNILDFIGNSTESCMQSGVVNGICQEIDGVIDQYLGRFKDLTVILTGGDSDFLSKRLKNSIFAHSSFLLEGLNYLLEYNKK